MPAASRSFAACSSYTKADHYIKKHIDLIKSKFPNKPILVGVNNNAQNTGPVDCEDGTKDPETFACTWNDWSRSQRMNYIDERHDQAKQRGFDFMYPVFFPACAKGDPSGAENTAPAGSPATPQNPTADSTFVPVGTITEDQAVLAPPARRLPSSSKSARPLTR